jgi:hypothetical protein
MPILGPNCYGLINYLDGALLWPDQHGGVRVERGVAIVTQSSNMAINIEKTKGASPFCNAQAGHLKTEFPALFHRSESGQLAAQSFHLGNPIQSNNPAEIARRIFLECFRPRDAEQRQQYRGHKGCPQSVKGGTQRAIDLTRHREQTAADQSRYRKQNAGTWEVSVRTWAASSSHP